MGEAILKGVLDSGFMGPGEIIFFEINKSRREAIGQAYKIFKAESIDDVIIKAVTILIAVKPQDINIILDEIKKSFDHNRNRIISIAAGIPTDYMENRLKSPASIIRVMPNAPALYKKGMAAISRGKFVKNSDLKFAEDLIGNIGDYVIVEEKFQNTATALSGSGPAYFFLFCKYMIEAGIKNGLDEDTARQMVINTMIGAGIMIKNSKTNIDGLIKMIASPGGTTEKALEEFYSKDLEKTIHFAVEKAIKRAHDLSKTLKQAE